MEEEATSPEREELKSEELASHGDRNDRWRNPTFKPAGRATHELGRPGGVGNPDNGSMVGNGYW